MKKQLQSILKTCLIFCSFLTFSNINAQTFGGINLGGINIDSVNSLKNEFVKFQSLTDSLNNVISTTLKDTSIVKDLENQVTTLQTEKDSLVKLIADSSKITSDSLIKLQAQLNTLKDKQDL